jgi:CTP:molybdopterin cytidylyltransferase MocA
MGQPKALLSVPASVPGLTLIGAHVAALRPHCQRVVVVLGCQAEAIRQTLDPEVEVLLNADWETSQMVDSVRMGLQLLPADDHVLITPVDAPPAPEPVLQVMSAGSGSAVPTHQSHPGHPVRVEIGAVLAALTRGTLADALAAAPRVEVDWPDITRNLNTPEAWAAYIESLSDDR